MKTRTGRRSLAAIVAATLSLLAVSAGKAEAADSDVASRMIQTGTDLYWTNYGAVEFGDDDHSLYVSSKSSRPFEKRVVYEEFSDNVDFGALTSAFVRGQWSYFVVVNDYAAGVSRIKQAPAPRGAAPVIATSRPLIQARDLITDGTSLFWSDGAGVRAVSVLGGAVRTLTNEPTGSSLAQDSANVYFSNGTRIRAVPKAGGAARNVVVTPNVVTDLFVRTAPTLTLFWGDVSGRVVGRNLGDPGETIYQAPTSGREVTSLSWTGDWLIWSDCPTGIGPCAVKGQSGPVYFAQPGGADLRDVQGDPSAFYFLDLSGPGRIYH